MTDPAGRPHRAILRGIAHRATPERGLVPDFPLSGFEGMDVSHRLRVQLVRTNVERGYIDFKKAV